MIRHIELKKDDFLNTPWEETIATCEVRECYKFSSLFHEREKEAIDSDDEVTAEVYALLGGISSLRLDLDSEELPFAPMFEVQGSRSDVIDDFDDNHLEVFSEIVSDISDPELRARIGDVLWIRKREHNFAELAIESYLESADNLEDPKKFSSCIDRIERALRLSATLDKQGSLFNKVISHIENILDKLKGEDPLFFSAKLMDLLLEYRLGENKKYSELSEKIAKNAEAEKDYIRARTYWEIKAKWNRRDKDSEAERSSLIHAAETYVKDSDMALERKPPSYMVASTHLGSAIEIYRRIGGETEKVEELRTLMLEYQQESKNEMGSFSTMSDLSKVREKAIKQVTGKELNEGLKELALMSTIPSADALRTEVKESLSKHPLQTIIPSVLVDRSGKVIGQKPSLISEDPKEAEEAMKVEMLKIALFHISFDARGLIEPVRNHILLEHDIRISDLFSVVNSNPFIPEGREYVYARGLYAGLNGDFMLASHLLIPQIEHSMRYVLSNAGSITSGLDSELIQEDYDLNRTLYMEKSKEIFGEDLIFTFQALLVERFGSNLRNKLAHGLMNYQDFFSAEVVYLWWFVLHICYIPIIARESSKDAEQN